MQKLYNLFFFFWKLVDFDLQEHFLYIVGYLKDFDNLNIGKY